jgi:hypothetical protein
MQIFNAECFIAEPALDQYALKIRIAGCVSLDANFPTRERATP